MDQRKEAREKLIKTLGDYRTWQLIIIFAMLSFVVMIFLRVNNTGMITRRDTVKLADQEGNTELTKERLADLQLYSQTHMNASTGRFFLEGPYKRDSDAIIQRAKEVVDKNPNGNVYRRASDVCDPIHRSYSTAYFQCYMNELAKYPPADYGSTEVKLPNPEMYKVEFISPNWTPDVAGWSMVAWAVLLVVIVWRTIVKVILILLLQRTKNRL